MSKVKDIVRKAYATKIMLNHSRWAKVLNSGQGVKAPRRCLECREVLTEGYDPTELDVASHQYDKLLEAGLGWLVDPTEAPPETDGQQRQIDYKD